MQPILPPKPHQDQQEQPTLESQLNRLKIDDNLSDRTDLPFKIIPSDFTTQLFTQKDGNSLNVPLPSYFEYITNAKIKELIYNEELLSGYLLTLYKEEFIGLKRELNAVIEGQQKAALELKNKYIDCDDGLLDKALALDTHLKEYDSKLKTFDHLQIEMYETLNGLSSKSIAKHFSDKAATNEANCSELLDNASSTEVELSSKQLEQLLQSYTTQRYEWHKNKECVPKLEHHKVVGLE